MKSLTPALKREKNVIFEPPIKENIDGSEITKVDVIYERNVHWKMYKVHGWKEVLILPF